MALSIQFSLDLTEEISSHVAFLREVRKSRQCFNAANIQMAVQRYERLWLPLAAARERDDIEPPLDIHWIWYLHLLHPRAYARDCSALVSKVPNHKLFCLHKSRETVRERTQLLWQKRYPKQSFHLPSLQPTEEFTTSCSVNFLKTALGQRGFIYQILLPHYKDEMFLDSAVERYKRMLAARRIHPDLNLTHYFAYDVELALRTHMLRPGNYKQDMGILYGELPDFESSCAPNSPAIVKDFDHPNFGGVTQYEDVEKLAPLPGSMFRGDSSESYLSIMTQADIHAISHKSCTIKVRKIKVENFNSTCSNVYIELGVFKWSNLDMNVSRLPARPAPPYEWTGSNKDLASLDWKTEGYEQFYVSVFRNNTKRLQSAKMKKGICGCLFEGQVTKLIESTHETDSSVGHVFAKTTSTPYGDVRFVVTAVLDHIKRIGVELLLKRGEFEKRVLPDNSKEIWGPVTLKKLPKQVTNYCSIALHKLYNHKEEECMGVRVIHSVPLGMAVVQVLLRERLVCTGHLIGSEQLPKPQQVTTGSSAITLDPNKGERAMIIKNGHGDWAILKGVWVHTGKVHKTPNYKRGHVQITWYDLIKGTNSTFNLSVPRSLEHDTTVEVGHMTFDLLSGKITIKPGTDDIAEYVVLSFCSAMLYAFCGPSCDPRDKQKFGCLSCSHTLTPFDLDLLTAAGFWTDMPDNHCLRVRALSITGNSLLGNPMQPVDDPGYMFYKWIRHGMSETRYINPSLGHISQESTSSSYTNPAFEPDTKL